MKVVVIGAGNVAYHLGFLIQQNGHDIVQLYNRSKASGSKLAIEFQCDFTTSIKDIEKNADLYIVALKDDVLEDFCKQLTFSPKLIVHTSGTCSIDIFPARFNSGVLYPVQTFSKTSERTPELIPFCIEARKKKDETILKRFVNSLNAKYYVKSSAEREKIHLAAVIVNNFTNHLFALSEQFLDSEKVSFDILRPLIVETALKVQYGKPGNLQTGPARRGDNKVIREHERILKKNPQLQKIYRLLTKSINDFYKGKR